MDFSRNAFMWIFIGIAVLILIAVSISSVIFYYKIIEINSKIDKVDNLADKLESNLGQLQGINTQISNINTNLLTLTTKYPPNQTLNINGINQQQLNSAINNAINLELENIKWKIDLNLWANIAFGSLLSISFIWYIIRRK